MAVVGGGGGRCGWRVTVVCVCPWDGCQRGMMPLCVSVAVWVCDGVGVRRCGCMTVRVVGDSGVCVSLGRVLEGYDAAVCEGGGVGVRRCGKTVTVWVCDAVENARCPHPERGVPVAVYQKVCWWVC